MKKSYVLFNTLARPAPLKGPLVSERRTTNHHSLSCRFIIFLIISIGPALLFLQIKGEGEGFYIKSALSGSYPNIPPNKDVSSHGLDNHSATFLRIE